jgi:hypothetical protein
MYRIIPGKELPTEFKIRVNPDQSAALQQHLFSIDYAFGGEKTVKFTDHKHLYIWSGIICINTLVDDEEHFKNYRHSQIYFEDYFEPIAGATSKPTSVPSKLRGLLEGMTQEEFDKSWEEIKNLRLLGPTIEEYLKSK